MAKGDKKDIKIEKMFKAMKKNLATVKSAIDKGEVRVSAAKSFIDDRKLAMKELK